MLNIDNCLLVVVDIQGNLAQLMKNKEIFFRQADTMIQGAKIFELPTLWLEQLPDKLGSTIPILADTLKKQGHKPIKKASFSAYLNDNFVHQLQKSHRKSVIIIGIEAHICIYQTVIDLLDNGYQVTIISDAVSSRNLEDKEIAMNKMRRAGAQISSTEMVLFELQRTACGERFKSLLKIIQ